MKVLVFIFIAALFAACSDNSTDPGDNHTDNETRLLYINEFLAKNDSDITDEEEKYEDWIEIYNPQDTAVNIGGWFISDDIANPELWQIPDNDPTSTTILPKGYLILWADKDTDDGILHIDMKLSGDGEQICLSRITNGNLTIIDSLSFPSQSADVSYGRIPDGGTSWDFLETTSPGSSNN